MTKILRLLDEFIHNSRRFDDQELMEWTMEVNEILHEMLVDHVKEYSILLKLRGIEHFSESISMNLFVSIHEKKNNNFYETMKRGDRYQTRTVSLILYSNTTLESFMALIAKSAMHAMMDMYNLNSINYAAGTDN